MTQLLHKKLETAIANGATRAERHKIVNEHVDQDGMTLEQVTAETIKRMPKMIDDAMREDAKRREAYDLMRAKYRAMLTFLHDDIAKGRVSHRLAAKRMGLDLAGLESVFQSAGLDNPWKKK
jgi:hypothetical protein